MTDFSKDQTYVELFVRNKKAEEPKRGEEEEKPASSQNFSFQYALRDSIKVIIKIYMNDAKLIVSDSVKNSNMFYAAGIIVPDDFIYLEKDNCKILYVDSLEFNRAQKESKADKVVNYLKYNKKTDKNSLNLILGMILKENRIKRVLVPENFKIKYAKILIELGIKIDIKKELFFEERSIKNKSEIRKILAVQKANEKAMARAVDIIKKSKIKKGKKLSYNGKILTSEFLKEVINIEFLKGSSSADFSIVSSGKDTADPHQLGKGEILANQPIIIDIFPRSQRDRYYSDMTRTFVKGKANPEMKKIYNTVLTAQELAIDKIKPGIRGSNIHRSVEEFFEHSGFKTLKEGEIIQGFIHGTGHGVGLDIHEPPFLSASGDSVLEDGNIVTVEPGLYYPAIGGVRIEDMVLVTKNGSRNLTNFPKYLEIT